MDILDTVTGMEVIDASARCDDAILIGSVVRETNHSLLSVLDRTGSTPVVHETTFDTRDFVAAYHLIERAR